MANNLDSVRIEEQRIQSSLSDKFQKKIKKHTAAVHFNFIHLKAAFETVWSKALWKMLGHIDVSGKRSLTLSKMCIDTTNVA